MKNQILEEIVEEENNVKNNNCSYFNDTKNMCINGVTTSVSLNSYPPIYQKQCFKDYNANNIKYHNNIFNSNSSNDKCLNSLESFSELPRPYLPIFSLQNPNNNSQSSLSGDSLSSPIHQYLKSCEQNPFNAQPQSSNITPTTLQSQLNLSQQEQMMLLFQQYMLQNSSLFFNQLLQTTQNPSLMLNNFQPIDQNAILNTSTSFQHNIKYIQQHLLKQKEQCNNLKKVIKILNKFSKKLKQDLSNIQAVSNLKKENSDLEKQINSMVYANSDDMNQNKYEKLQNSTDENNDFLEGSCGLSKNDEKDISDPKQNNILNVTEFLVKEQNDDTDKNIDLDIAEFPVKNRRNSVEEEGWSCKACTFINHALINQCEVCEMPKL